MLRDLKCSEPNPPIFTPSCSCDHRRRRKRTGRDAAPPARAGSFIVPDRSSSAARGNGWVRADCRHFAATALTARVGLSGHSQDTAVSPWIDRSDRLVCSISLIAEGQATNSFASLRIVASGGMSYLTERLIHNTRVQENVFLSVNNIPIDQIGSYGNRSVIVVSGAAFGKNDNRDSRCVILYAGNGETIIFKSPFFRVNFVIGCVGCDTIGAINYKGVCRWLMPSVTE